MIVLSMPSDFLVLESSFFLSFLLNYYDKNSSVVFCMAFGCNQQNSRALLSHLGTKSIFFVPVSW